MTSLRCRRGLSARLLVTLAALAASLVVGVGFGETTSSAPPGIRGAVQGLVHGQVPGALLYVRQDERSYTVAVGYADKVKKVPMRASDIYPIGSTTKSYTAVVVMHLVAQGRIRLDAPVSTYLPGLLPDGKRITVRELLSHTSGLYDFANDPRFTAPYLHGKLGFAWTPRQMVGFAARKQLLFSPGSKFSYSNTNYIVLALLAERVGGESYAKQLREYIFRPLELSHTSLPADNKILPDVHGYTGLIAQDGGAGSAPVDTAALTPAFAWSVGGIRATAEDVADFYRGLLSGKLLPKAQVQAMEVTAPTGGAYGLGLMPTDARAYGWGPFTKAINATCGRAWGHGGEFPGYYQLPISSPDGSRQAVLLVNADSSLMPRAQLKQIYKVLETAYCRGVPS